MIRWPTSFGRSDALLDIGLLLAVLLAATLVKLIVVTRLLRVDARKPPLDDPRVFAVEYLMAPIVLPGMTLLLARHGQTWADLGLRLPTDPWFAPKVAALVICMLATNACARRASSRGGGAPASPYAAVRGRTAPFLVMLVYALFFVGLIEELSFRGILLSRIAFLLEPMPHAWYFAAAIVAALFGAAHLSAGAFMGLNAMLAGLLLGVAYVAWRDLALVVAAHSLYDAVKITLYYRASGPPKDVGEDASAAPVAGSGHALGDAP